MKPRGLSKRMRQVIHLAAIRDYIAREKGYPMPSTASIARMQADYNRVAGEIIADLLKAHDRDRDSFLKARR